MFQCYLDCKPVKTFDFEEDAELWCENNADLGEVGYEYVGDDSPDCTSDCGPF